MNIGKVVKVVTVPKETPRAIPIKNWPRRKKDKPIPIENWPVRIPEKVEVR